MNKIVKYLNLEFYKLMNQMYHYHNQLKYNKHYYIMNLK